MDLAVLIVSYNSELYLTECLRSLSENLRGIAHEICVIDNASRDHSAKLIIESFPSVQLIQNNRNRGFAAAINQGIQNTSAPFIFWMNPDARITDGTISALLDYFRQYPAAGILGTRILNRDHSIQLSCRSFPSYSTAFFNRYSFMTRLFPHNAKSRAYLKSDSDHRNIEQTDWVSGAGLLHRRSLVDAIGPLDENYFMYCEDVDFCLRAQKAGWRTFFHPGLTLEHSIGGSSKTVPRKMILERHRSIWHYYKKHFTRNPLKDCLIASGIIIRCLFLLSCSLFKGKHNES